MIAARHADLVAGRQDVGQHEGFLVGHAVGDQVGRGVGVRDADVLGLGAVDPVPEHPAAALRALPVATLAAEPAGTARADAGDENPVARPEPTDAIADLVDGSHGLMAEDPARVHSRHVAGQDVQVGAADRRRVDPDDDIALVGDLRVRHLFPGLLAGTVIHERPHGCLRSLFGLRFQPRLGPARVAGAEGPFARAEGLVSRFRLPPGPC
jgi:hypothetical protein